VRITRRCKIKIAINIDYVDEVECKVAPLDACEVMFSSTYLWKMDVNFYMRENKYRFLKGG
jgi:hypothetical protein